MDIEQMHAAASEEYQKNYSTGEYCHEQSFLWGFQETQLESIIQKIILNGK
jgi:hypothetical protein